MKIYRSLAVLSLLASGLVLATTPQKLNLKNQYGETSLNAVYGTYLPLPGNQTFNQVVMFTGVTITPTAATGVNVAGAGSLYIGRNPASYGSSKVFLNIGTITAPAWTLVGP